MGSCIAGNAAWREQPKRRDEVKRQAARPDRDHTEAGLVLGNAACQNTGYMYSNFYNRGWVSQLIVGIGGAHVRSTRHMTPIGSIGPKMQRLRGARVLGEPIAKEAGCRSPFVGGRG